MYNLLCIQDYCLMFWCKTLPLSPQVYKWTLVNLMLGVTLPGLTSQHRNIATSQHRIQVDNQSNSGVILTPKRKTFDCYIC